MHWGFEANEEKHSPIPAKECRNRLERFHHFLGKVKWLEPRECECLDSFSPAAPLVLSRSPHPHFPFSPFKGSTLSHKSSCEVTSFIILSTGGSLAHIWKRRGGGTETVSHPWWGQGGEREVSEDFQLPAALKGGVLEDTAHPRPVQIGEMRRKDVKVKTWALQSPR